jgi:(S)-sulfolactate dehydrogenase
MPDIVITEFMDDGPVEELKAKYDVHWDKTLCERPDDIKPLLGDAVALIVRNRTPVTDDIISAGPNLKVLGRLGVGLDNIDVQACERRGVKVCPATGSNNVTVAEYTICTMLMLLRGSFYSKADILAGKWPRSTNIGLEARGRTLGILGLGMIGSATARMASGLEMQVIASDPYIPADAPGWEYAQNVSFEDLIARSDILTVHVPLQPDTLGIIDAAAMAGMKKASFLINTARGGVIEEDALIGALKSGHISGAALDVFADEPLSAQTAAKFADAPNLILTPHISGVTVESGAAIGRITVDNVLRELAAS